jgi:hypothetical protein
LPGAPGAPGAGGGDASASSDTTVVLNESGGGGGGGIAIGGFSGAHSGDGDALAGLSAADLERLANRCILVLRHPKRYKKRTVDICWLVARRVPRVAQAAGVQVR